MIKQNQKMHSPEIQSKAEPIKVLHVVGAMNRGGAETWLMHVLRSVDPKNIRMDFITHTSQKGDYDDEIKSLGGTIHFIGNYKNPLTYYTNLSKVLNANEYDVIHSHVHIFSAIPLFIAWQRNVPGIVIHSHIDYSYTYKNENILQTLKRKLFTFILRKVSTDGLAASEVAAIDLFGKDWVKNSKFRILFCGIDMKPFQKEKDDQLRMSLGFLDEDIVFGHIGRFVPQKNHTFLVDVFKALVQKLPQAKLLLVGKGDLFHTIKQKCIDFGLDKQVVLAGTREDISDLFISVFDYFLFPSLFEGLPLVLMECQAGGVPLFTSEALAEEAVIIPEIFHRLSLQLQPEQWADAIISYHKTSTTEKVSKKECLRKAMNSGMNIDYSVNELLQVYSKYKRI
jgi:glycosyltransferase involved in cell wall biosynthesis